MIQQGEIVTPAIEVDPEEVDVEVVLAEDIEVGDRVLVEQDEKWWLIPLKEIVIPKPRYVFQADWPSDGEYPLTLRMEKRGNEQVVVIDEGSDQ